VIGDAEVACNVRHATYHLLPGRFKTFLEWAVEETPSCRGAQPSAPPDGVAGQQSGFSRRHKDRYDTLLPSPTKLLVEYHRTSGGISDRPGSCDALNLPFLTSSTCAAQNRSLRAP
jgi:hypothetical protein